MHETRTDDRRGRAALGAAAALIAGVVLGRPALAPAGPEPGPLVFEDISAVSGGTVDFGEPTSSVEKATCAWVDVDGDGWDDLITLTGVDQPCGYFLNREDGEGGRALVPAPAGSGLDSGTPLRNDGSAITVGDVDGDGDEDLYIGCGWNPSIPSGENALLLNDGTGVFTDVTAAAGLLDGDNTTAACVFFDMDLDGDLDLVSANTEFAEAGKSGDGRLHLFRNMLAEEGVLRFADERKARGIVEVGRAIWQVSAFDYDLDGAMDLLVTHDIKGLTQLFLNDGTGHFSERPRRISAGPGDDGDPSTFGNDSHSAMGVAVADVENDGDLDFYIANVAYNPLYVNNGDGTLRELGKTRGCARARVSWGVLFQDFDNDGFVDLHVAAGDFWDWDRDSIVPHLFHNRGDGSFDEVFEQSGMRHDPPLHREGGTAAADFDADGRVDIVVCRSHRHTGASPYLYRNCTDTTGRHWISILLRPELAGTNRSGVGAIVRALPRDANGDHIAGLTQIRHVTASDSRGARSSLWQTFGLGSDAVSVDVHVTWPRAGSLEERTQVFRGLDLDRRRVLTDAATPPRWRMESVAHAEVVAGHPAELNVRGTGDGAASATCRLEEGPQWATLTGYAGGSWDVALEAPVVQEATDFVLELTAEVPDGVGVPPVASRQTLTVTVLPAPHVAAADIRRRGRRLRLFGANFPRRAVTVLVDGVVCPRVLVRGHHREPDGEGSRLVAVLPRELRPAFRDGAHVVEVIDELTGRASAPFEFTPER